MKDRLLWLGCLLYAALLSWLGVIKYDVHRNLVDFGIFAQTVASAFGCFCNPIEGSHWAFHFSPILYAIGALVAFAHTPLTLVVLQAIAGALAAPPIYGLVLRERGDVRTARLAALVVLLYPALAGLIFNDFHENGFAPAAVAWTLYAFDAGYLRWAIAGAIVTLSVKEDQAIFLAIAGALGAWRFRRTAAGRTAGVVAVVSLLVAVWYFRFVQPHAAIAAGWQPERFYAWTAADVRALFFGGLAARFGFVLLAFVPLLFLPFRSRMMWLAAAPLGEVLFSRMSTTFTLGSHYAGAWIGYVLVAFAFAVRQLNERAARAALVWCAVLCVVEFLIADPLHPGLNLRPVETRDVRLDAFVNSLPFGVSIATQEEAYTHLALEDPYARLLPESPQIDTEACFVLIDTDFPRSARLQEYGATLERLIAAGAYVLADRSGGIFLYRRIGGCR